MAMMEQQISNNRLMDLERVVDMLNGQLRALQRELQHTKYGSLAERLRINWASMRRNRIFMSAVCNQRIRPNTKEAYRGASRTSR
jgi:hypothetical protein